MACVLMASGPTCVRTNLGAVTAAHALTNIVMAYIGLAPVLIAHIVKAFVDMVYIVMTARVHLYRHGHIYVQVHTCVY